MTRRAVVAFAAVVVFAGCPAPEGQDAGISEDSGVDAGAQDAGRPAPDASVEFLDGGLLIYGGGCVSPDQNKVIFIVDSRDPQWCAYISMRRWDGGFPALFPNFSPPENFKVDEARWDVCKDLELPTSLDPNGIPLDDLSGEMKFSFVFQGRPRAYVFDGGIRMGTYAFRTDIYAGLVRDCKGN